MAGEAAALVCPFHADPGLPDRSGRAPVRRTGAETIEAGHPCLNKATRNSMNFKFERLGCCFFTMGRADDGEPPYKGNPGTLGRRTRGTGAVGASAEDAAGAGPAHPDRAGRRRRGKRYRGGGAVGHDAGHRRRFVAAGCDGLLDGPRSGAPRRIGDADVKRVVAMTLESIPRDATRWSTRSMAAAGGVSRRRWGASGGPSV